MMLIKGWGRGVTEEIKGGTSRGVKGSRVHIWQKKRGGWEIKQKKKNYARGILKFKRYGRKRKNICVYISSFAKVGGCRVYSSMKRCN